MPVYLRKSCAFPVRLTLKERLCRRSFADGYGGIAAKYFSRFLVKQSFTGNRATKP